MDTLGIETRQMYPITDTSWADTEYRLEQALIALRNAREKFKRIDALYPWNGDEASLAVAVGKATGVAVGGMIEIDAHMRYIQHDPIESNQEGGDNHGD